MSAEMKEFKNFWKPALVVIASVFLYATVLSRLGHHWWTDENYSHGLLIPFVIAYFVWFRFDSLKNLVSGPSVWIGGTLMVGAICMLLAGTLGAELFLQRISLAVFAVGLIVYFFGMTLMRALAVPFLLFLLAIPIPQILFNKIAFPLQIYASQFAVWGIRVFGVPTVRKGNVIEILPEGSVQVIALEVVEACSGIRSLMTLVALALILAYFTRGREFVKPGKWLAFISNKDVIRGAILMISAIPIAVFTNAARVTSTGVLTYFYGIKATESTFHEVSGWLVYIVALGLLVGLNFLLMKVFKLIENDQKDVIAKTEFREAPGWILWAAVALILSGGLFINWFETRGEIQVERVELSKMSNALGEWKQKGSDIKFSEETESVLKTSDYVMREYVKNGRLANVYVGYYASQKTGATYHSPQNCLPGSGWEMKKPELITVKTSSGKEFQVNRYIIENGKYKEVMLYWYQGRGRTQASEYSDKIYTVLDSVLKRRSDGSMVRIMTSVGNSPEAATKEAVELAGELYDNLESHIPQ